MEWEEVISDLWTGKSKDQKVEKNHRICMKSSEQFNLAGFSLAYRGDFFPITIPVPRWLLSPSSLQVLRKHKLVLILSEVWLNKEGFSSATTLL